jgi:hypothetical protein
MLSTQQIGKAGELLVQLRLLLRGVESAPLTTDAGVDLVAYSSRKQSPVTIQVKSNLKPKPAGGKGKPTLDWWIPDDSPAQLIALTDVSAGRIWLFKLEEIRQLAQQHSRSGYHLHMYVDPSTQLHKPSRLSYDYEFEQYRFEIRLHKLL